MKALRMLGWTAAPARLFESLSDAEAREIELEENENRKDFTQAERERTFEKSKQMVEDSKTADEAISLAGKEKTKNPRGRKRKGKSTKKDIAEAMGVSEATLIHAEQHVEFAERYPFMKSWRQSGVLAVKERLEESVPAADRDAAMGVLAVADLLDPGQAAAMLSNIGGMTPAKRKELYVLANSKDSRERSLALTTAAAKPPLPDVRLVAGIEAVRMIENAAKELGQTSKQFPPDEVTPLIDSILADLKNLVACLRSRGRGKETIQ